MAAAPSLLPFAVRPRVPFESPPQAGANRNVPAGPAPRARAQRARSGPTGTDLAFNDVPEVSPSEATVR
jgi:hypothetical protein